MRPFRLAATHVAKHLVDAFVELRKQRSDSLAMKQFEHDIEVKKGRAANQVKEGGGKQ